MEIEARLHDNKVTIHIEDLDLSNLANLTEQTVKECVRPLIKSRLILDGCTEEKSEMVSYLACYGGCKRPSTSEEDRCKRQDLESPDTDEERQ